MRQIWDFYKSDVSTFWLAQMRQIRKFSVDFLLKSDLKKFQYVSLLVPFGDNLPHFIANSDMVGCGPPCNQYTQTVVIFVLASALLPFQIYSLL